MKKKIIIATIILAFGSYALLSINVNASTNRIISFGSIDFSKVDSQKAALYAQDLQYLKNEIDQLKAEIH